MANIISKAIPLSVVILLVCIALFGCKSGGRIIVVGDIEGPYSIGEQMTAEFSISVEGGTGVAIQWTCSPPDAGIFDAPTSAKTGFAAGEVTADTDVEIRVVINAHQFGPVVKSKNITILDSIQLIISEIDGPSTLYENSQAVYGISATGDTGINYLWSILPPEAGEFDSPASASTAFVAWEVSTNVEADIQVEINSDLYGPAFVTKAITIIDTPGWAHAWGGAESDTGWSVAVDASGNIYVAGTFTLTVDFDPGDGIDEHASNGNDDVFISKFNSKGEFIWAITLGSDSDDWCLGVGVDNYGNIYATGFFVDSVDFDPGPGTEIHTSECGVDHYLCKFDPDGNLLWARNWGGMKKDYEYSCGRGNDVAAGGAGDVYVAGYFRETVDFDPGPGACNITSHAGSDAYLSKFNINGDFLWVAAWGSIGTDECEAVAVDDLGNAYVTGGFKSTVDFDPGPGIDEHTANQNAINIFISKFNSDGEHQWAGTWGGNLSDYGRGVAVDADGCPYVSGSFDATVDFDPGPGSDYHSAVDYHDAFLSKFDPDGNFIWARTWGAESGQQCRGLAADDAGFVYAAGYFFRYAVDFDPGPGIDEHESAGEYDAFLSKFNSDGDFIWVRTWGGAGHDMIYGAAAGNSGFVYITGYFQGTADFDPGPGVCELTSHGWSDAFINQIPPDGNW